MFISPRLLRPILLAAVPMLFAVPARADIYSVGTEGCSHATIQQAVDAAEANPGEDFIRIPHNQVWNGQAIVINTAQTLWFEGYWSDCNTIDDSTHTTLDGGGGSAAPVIRIEAAAGSVIGFDFLDIRNGDVSGNGGKGGGIWYRGNGTLSIKNGSIYNNTAGRGGGLYLEGTGDAATVHVLANVGITGNVARDSGGGVFAEAVRLYMTASPNSVIAFNEAAGFEVLGEMYGGYGGGLVVNSTTSLHGYALIGSAGVGSTGAIHANTARYGGGIAVLGESGSAGTYSHLYLHATLDGVPAKISQNFASVEGGGIYADDASGSAAVHVWNATLEGNAAAQGSAMSLGGTVSEFNVTRPADAIPCPVGGEPCLRIVGNMDQDALGQSTDGAVIRVEGGSARFGVADAGASILLADARGTSLTGNRGGNLLELESTSFAGCNLLMSDNQLGMRVVGATGASPVTFCDSTIAGNTLGFGEIFIAVASDLGLHRMLLWQPGANSLYQFGGSRTVESTLASEAGSLGGAPGAIAIESPRFIDPGHGDYRLRAASPAIDFALPMVGDDRDVAGLPRDQRIGPVPRPQGHVRDIGAHERSSLQPPVLNGDFAGDTNLWFLPSGHAGNFQIDNAPGSIDGTGSAQVAGTSSEGRLLGYAQCIHLPGPGTYALNGSARSESAQLSNPTALIWELRHDGGEGCIDGPITTGGTHAIGTQASGDQWIRPAQPALITVSGSEWNHNTSLTVIMAVYPYADGNAYNGLFDYIALEWSAGSDAIFADGFDGP